MKLRNVDPKILCRNHLLGEHYECHLFIGHLRKKRRIDGYIKNNLVEIKKIVQRHGELANEMIRRGMNHKSPLSLCDVPDLSYLCEEYLNYKIDYDLCLEDTLRCEECKLLYYQLLKENKKRC